jgi:N-acetylmuramoyl-L-alanine amidase
VLQAVRVGDGQGTISLDLGPRFGSYRASLVPHDANAELVIDLVPAAAETPFPAPPRPAAPAPAGPLAPVPSLPPPALRTVVIDPGHGGDENGAVGASGALEKDITLAIARRLKAGLESRLGVRVLMTREGDQTVPLDDRAALANNNKGDLLISIHANASLRPDVSGAQVYYLSADEAGEEARRAAAARQTLPALGGGSRDVEMILWEVAQVRHLSDSAVLAGMVEERMKEAVPLNARPLQQAPFRVLAGANMPAILVEVGFLTNAAEEGRLKSESHQEAIARALLDAVTRFRDARADAFRDPLPQAVPR